MHPDSPNTAPDPGFVPGVQPDTLPISRSPYGNWRAGAPPPPPTGGLRRPPPYQPPPARRSRGILVGIISAVVLVIAAVAGLFVADPGLFVTAKTADIPATATVTPLATSLPTATFTAMPTATLTPAPTATDTSTPTPTATMPPPPGFQSYVGSDWTIDYPANVTDTPGSVTVQGVAIPSVSFDLGHSAQLTVYDSPQAATATEAQQILTAALATSGASAVTIVDPLAPATIGVVTWQRIKVSAKLHGVPTTIVALYVPHDPGAIVIAYSAPAATFATIETQTCLPIVQTFMFAT